MWKATCQHQPQEFVVYPALPDRVEQDAFWSTRTVG